MSFFFFKKALGGGEKGFVFFLLCVHVCKQGRESFLLLLLILSVLLLSSLIFITCTHFTCQHPHDQGVVYRNNNKNNKNNNPYLKKKKKRFLALVCLMKQEAYQNTGFVEFNFEVFKNAITKLFEAKEKERLARLEEQR